MSFKPKSKRDGKKPEVNFSAHTADRHKLYELSVQNPEADADFIDSTFKAMRGRTPVSLREDFCGTAALCSEWVSRSKTRTAMGLDLDTPTLDWGTKHNVTPMGDASNRIQLLQKNVMDPIQVKNDVVVAFNFSYCIFKDRKSLLDYFKQARAGLSSDGAFFVDIHGGSESFENLEEIQQFEGYEYVWDQEVYDPINGTALRYIHFRFPDGTEMERAFEYDWRIWTLPELTDLLREAGFSGVEVYWEGDDGDGEGNGIFTKTDSVENELSWVAYVVGWV